MAFRLVKVKIKKEKKDYLIISTLDLMKALEFDHLKPFTALRLSV